MKQIKKINDGIGFVRKEAYKWEDKDYEADIQNGDKVKILSEGEMEEGQFGEQMVFKVETRNGTKKYPINQLSRNILIDTFGDEDKDWIGKELNILTRKGMYAGKKGIASYIVPDGWVLDEYGDLVKPENTETTDYTVYTESLATIEYPGEE